MRGLTERDMTMCRMVRTGMTNEQIGGYLGLGPSAVRQSLTRVFRAYEVVNRTELAAVFGADVEMISADAIERLTNLRVEADKRYHATTFGSAEYYKAVGALAMIVEVIAEITAAQNHDESRT